MTMERVYKLFNGRNGKPYRIKGVPVCTATHPDMPNYSGHSRGRKLHLAKNEERTICNMLIDTYMPSGDTNWSMTHNGKCKNCFK